MFRKAAMRFECGGIFNVDRFVEKICSDRTVKIRGELTKL